MAASEESVRPDVPATNPSSPVVEVSDKLKVTDESLMAELNAYAEALRQEFAESQSRQEQPDVEKHTRDFFKKNIQDAALQVVWLAHNSDSDSVRLRACQIIIKEAFDQAQQQGDPLKELMLELSKPTPTPNSSARGEVESQQSPRFKPPYQTR